MNPGSFCLAGVNEADRCRVKKLKQSTRQLKRIKRGKKSPEERENSKLIVLVESEVKHGIFNKKKSL